MTSASTARSGSLGDLAAVLAQGYVRLTETRRVSGVSGTDSEAEKQLDLSRQPSGHVDYQPAEGRPRWT